MKHRLLHLFCFCVLFSSAQSGESNYVPISNYQPEKSYLTELCSGYDSIYKAIDFEKRSEGKNFKAQIEGPKKAIFSMAEDSTLMKNDEITQYLQTLVEDIKRKNPALARKYYTVFTDRSAVANAFNLGNGIIIFNLNLVARMKTEGNIAFILCHEISHDLRGHVIDGIIQSYKVYNDPAEKKRYDEIRKQENNSLKSYESYVAHLMQRVNSRNRAREIQADSLGLLLFNNAGYDLNQAYEAINMLDSIDQFTERKPIDFKKILYLNDNSFKSSWLLPEDQEESIDGGNLEGVKFPDSLKTHPDCAYRLQKMKAQRLTGKNFGFKTGQFESIHKKSQYEMLRVHLENYNLDEGIYDCMQLLNKNPNNTYLKASLVEYLYLVYMFKRKHYFSLFVGRSAPENIPSYNELLNLLNQLSPDECLEITTNYFRNAFPSTTITDPYQGFVWLLLKSIDKTAEEKAELVSRYQKEFGKNTYYHTLKRRLIKK